MLPKVPLLTLLQPALQITAIVLLFVVLLCPNPFTESGMDLMVVRPYNISSTSTTSAATSTIVVSVTNTSTATAVPTSSTTASTISSTTTAPTATSNNTSAASTSSTTPTSNASTSTTTSAAQIGLTPATTSSSTASLARREYTLPNLSNLEAMSNSSTSSASTTLYSNQEYSLLELKYGPLGGCFRDATGVRTCTPASMSPSLASLNARLSIVGQLSTTISITGLPSAFKITPILLFVTFSTLFLLYLLSVPQLLPRLFPKSTKFSTYLSPESRVQQYLGKVVGLAVYARMGCIGLLLGAGISLRLKVSKAIYAFNAANISNAMPASLTLIDSDDIGMQAVVGSSFSLIWATVVLIGVEVYLERKRIASEAAIAQARKDIESQYGRGVFEMLEEARSRGDLSAKAESIYQSHAPSIKPARSVYGGSEYGYGADTKERPTKSVMRAASFKSTGSSYYNGPQRYPSSDKDLSYNGTGPPSRRVQLHPASSQEWLDETDKGGYYEQPGPFSGPGWADAHPSMGLQPRSLSRSRSRSRSRAASPTPSYWTTSGKEALDASTLHTLPPSRMDKRGSYAGSDVDPDMEHPLPPRGPSALSDYSIEPSRSVAGVTGGRRQLQTGHAGATTHTPFANLRRNPSYGSRLARGPSSDVHQQDQEDQKEEDDSEEYLDSHHTAGSVSEERRRRDREREELAALEREILQRRRRELEWQMGRDQDRAAAAAAAANASTRSSTSNDDGKVVGLGRLGYRKAVDGGRI